MYNCTLSKIYQPIINQRWGNVELDVTRHLQLYGIKVFNRRRDQL